MKPSVYPVDLDAPGRLFLMPKPSGEWLRDDLAHLATLGICVVVSLLEPDEARELGLGDERQVCGDLGLTFFAAPIPDRGLPEADAFAALALDLAARLRAGAGVAAHCRAGIGRSGMAVCCVLAAFGLSAEEALARVSRARSIAVPDTAEQAAFIRQIAPRIAASVTD